jgi:hypothetical protein
MSAMNRREFVQWTAAGGMLCLGAFNAGALEGAPVTTSLVSPGCRRSKVKVARLFFGSPSGLWPKPNLDFRKEMDSYRQEFARRKEEFADVEFPVDELITSVQQLSPLEEKLRQMDGILVIHLSIGISDVLRQLLSLRQPTTVFAVPYSGHEWAHFGELRKQPLGAQLECILSSDTSQLAEAIKPFRAIHHLREAKVVNLSTADFSDFAKKVRSKFGTEIVPVTLERMVALYDSIDDRGAQAETEKWIGEAKQVVEPSRENIFKSCKLALAFEKLLAEENATVMTVDCYGTMWDKTIKLPAYPCLGFARLNNLGLGGICESDLRCALTHILFQGLTGRPSFISDPTVDESKGSIILAHCLGTPKMDGPAQTAATYKIRTVMERQEGVVPQVEMCVGQRVTQGILTDVDTFRFFTGSIIEAPVGLEVNRGCRTKINVKVDGNITRLWQNWTAGLHRQTVYGDIAKTLGTLGRFKNIRLIDEAA